MIGPTEERSSRRDRSQVLLAAIIAPPVGLLSIAAAIFIAGRMETTPRDPFRGAELQLFLLLLLGILILYFLEFLLISYFRTRREGTGLGLGGTLVAFTLVGVIFSPLATHFLLTLAGPREWLQVSALGGGGALISGLTYWLLAPERV